MLESNAATKSRESTTGKPSWLSLLLLHGMAIQRSARFALLVSVVVFHPTHLGIVTFLLGAALIARLFTATISSVGIMALGFAVGIGFASEIGFAMLVEKSLGARVTRPPVLMARVIADGTGARYLREKCPQADFAVCQFADRLLTNSDAFLWETLPRPEFIQLRQ